MAFAEEGRKEEGGTYISLSPFLRGELFPSLNLAFSYVVLGCRRRLLCRGRERGVNHSNGWCCKERERREMLELLRERERTAMIMPRKMHA